MLFLFLSCQLSQATLPLPGTDFVYTAIPLSSTCFSHGGLLPTPGSAWPYSFVITVPSAQNVFSIIILCLLIVQVNQISIP